MNGDPHFLHVGPWLHRGSGQFGLGRTLYFQSQEQEPLEGLATLPRLDCDSDQGMGSKCFLGIHQHKSLGSRPFPLPS